MRCHLLPLILDAADSTYPGQVRRQAEGVTLQAVVPLPLLFITPGGTP